MPGTTSFPGALDTFPDIQPDTAEDAEGFEHDLVHNNIAAAVAAVQEKLGIDDSEDEASIDARIAALESAASTVLHYRRTDLVATGGETVISTVQDPYEGSLELYLDGTLLALDDYAVSGHILTLDNAASGGEVYTVRYLTESSGTTDALWVEALTLTGDFADGTIDEAYESDITITGGDGNYSLTGGTGVASGTLPAGLSLSIVEVSGTYYLRLSGMPTSLFDDTFTVSVDSGDGQTATSVQGVVVWDVVALLHFDGDDDSADFVDETGRIWTPHATAHISTDQARFGTASMECVRNTTAPIYTAGGDDIQLGTGDFTIEGFFLPGVPSSNQIGIWYIHGLNSIGGLLLGLTPTKVYHRCAGITDHAYNIDEITDWTHVAWERAAGITTIYVAGSAVGSFSTEYNNDESSTLDIGSNRHIGGTVSYSYSGFLDEVRVTRGRARYMGNFSPPTGPFSL